MGELYNLGEKGMLTRTAPNYGGENLTVVSLSGETLYLDLLQCIFFFFFELFFLIFWVIIITISILPIMRCIVCIFRYMLDFKN